jgi:hypothetical protein
MGARPEVPPYSGRTGFGLCSLVVRRSSLWRPGLTRRKRHWVSDIGLLSPRVRNCTGSLSLPVFPSVQPKFRCFFSFGGHSASRIVTPIPALPTGRFRISSSVRCMPTAFSCKAVPGLPITLLPSYRPPLFHLAFTPNKAPAPPRLPRGMQRPSSHGWHKPGVVAHRER